MKPQSLSLVPEPRGQAAPAADRPLAGRALKLARVAWVLVAALAVGLFVAGLPLVYAHTRTVCVGASCPDDRLTPAGVAALAALGLSVDFLAMFEVARNIFAVLVFGIVGALIFWRRSDDRVGLLASLTLVVFGAATFTDAIHVLALFYPSLWLPVTTLEYLGQVAFLILFCVFPDGRFEPRWLRWLAAFWLVYQFSTYFFRGTLYDADTWSAALSAGLWLGSLGLLVGGQIYRYRRVSTALQRQQTKWVVFGLAVGIGGFLAIVTTGTLLRLPFVLGSLSSFVVVVAIDLFVLLIPLSIGVAILRYRLWDIDVLINRALVYAILTLCVVVIYVLVVGYLGLLFQTSGNLLISLSATGLVAVLFQPLRDRVQRGVNRLLYGERDDPYAALSRLGQRLETTLAPEAVLPAIVETVAQALRLPYAEIVLDQDGDLVSVAEYREKETRRPGDKEIVEQNAASWSPGLLVSWSLVYQGELVGELRLAPRAGESGFDAADRRLLGDLARQAGVAAHAVRLTAALQGSRERLVAAREEERRRLRRDLHDGLGPQLASLTLKLDAARNLIDRDAGAADAMLADLKSNAQAAIADIRRLVYALRPPALDELGLVGALRQQIAQYQSDTLRVQIDAPERLPALPAAVEVAAYRIVLEALTNVVKHAGARNCVIGLGVERGLCLDIRDDGQGLPPVYGAGVGLHSMRERAAELGGHCEIGPAPGGGTSVVAWLPLP